MAEQDEQDEAQSRECQACRGTGKVISNLGGTPNTVDCPWCEGTGEFIPEHHAQEKWASKQRADA